MTTFHNLDITGIGQKDAVSGLEDNIKGFLDWSFLHIGGFINVDIPTSGVENQSSFHYLKPVSDPSQKIKLWEAPRKDWVYENVIYSSGISYNGVVPNTVSGVYLNGTFLPGPTGSGNYGYNINYPLGRIDFDNNVSPTSKVSTSYAYRYVQVYKSNEAQWWKEVQKETYNPSSYKPSGDYSITANHRVQLPAIIIELIPRTVQIPYELGTTRNIVIQDLFLHVFAENPGQRNSITEILLLQKDKTLKLYDVNKVVKNNAYPINKYGNINQNGFNYNILSDQYTQHWCTIKDSSIGELNNLSSNLFNGIVRWSIEIFP